jgi:hypothetical protein
MICGPWWQAYSRRWQIEHMWRACKSELAFESPRLHDWEHRRRLLMLASLVYAFLLELMQPPWEGTRDWMFGVAKKFCAFIRRPV